MTRQFAFPRDGRKLLCLLLALLLSALLLPAQTPAHAETAQSVPAADPVSQSEAFSAVLYNNTNGLPTSEANDIAQTGEGRIFVGTTAGVTMFDEALQPHPLTDPRIADVYMEPSGCWPP